MLIIPIISIMFILSVISIVLIFLIIPNCNADKHRQHYRNKTPSFLSIACPQFTDQCEIINVYGLPDLCKRLLLLAAVGFLMNDHRLRAS